MTGRGIDQAISHPCDPQLSESSIHDARGYARLAEEINGPIPSAVTPDYIWGDALAEIKRFAPCGTVVNLETAVTTDGRPWPHKDIHYRMHPDHIGCLAAARIDVCALANNHVLDYGEEGFSDTLSTITSKRVHPPHGRPTTVRESICCRIPCILRRRFIIQLRDPTQVHLPPCTKILAK